MKLKHLFMLALTAFLISSLNAQKENTEIRKNNELKILNETSTMPLDFDHADNLLLFPHGRKAGRFR